jgi:hypothetical protein
MEACPGRGAAGLGGRWRLVILLITLNTARTGMAFSIDTGEAPGDSGGQVLARFFAVLKKKGKERASRP